MSRSNRNRHGMLSGLLAVSATFWPCRAEFRDVVPSWHRADVQLVPIQTVRQKVADQGTLRRIGPDVRTVGAN
jgi:hypothetical protein